MSAEISDLKSGNKLQNNQNLNSEKKIKIFQNRISLCRPGCLGTYSVAQAASVSRVAGIKGSSHCPAFEKAFVVPVAQSEHS